MNRQVRRRKKIIKSTDQKAGGHQKKLGNENSRGIDLGGQEKWRSGALSGNQGFGLASLIREER